MTIRRLVSFLQDLSQNNSKDWMDQHRNQWLEVRDGFREFVSQVNEEVRKFDHDLPLENPVKYVQRINRDIRFSKNKLPYRNDLGFVITQRKYSRVEEPGYYSAVNANGTMIIAGGLWFPEVGYMRNLRKHLDSHGYELRKILKKHVFKKVFTGLDDSENSMYKMKPSAFKESQFLDLMMHKNWAVDYTISIGNKTDLEIIREVITGFKILHSYIQWLREVEVPGVSEK
jgi:uncharacterized protein (TIGR02453 family)